MDPLRAKVYAENFYVIEWVFLLSKDYRLFMLYLCYRLFWN